MLYLVATPIGNLEDFSFRAVRILQNCDYILCEDTRHSHTLLKHYAIQTPLKSFHQFNEKRREEQVLNDLKEGKTLALISDAGTPLISDPGEELILACIKNNIAISSIPGPCAITTALTLSGLPSTPFQFIGFLPKKTQALKECLENALLYSGTTLAYESPHRIQETLTLLNGVDPDCYAAIARELTKTYEEVLRGTASDLLSHFKEHPPRGEMVLLISPKQKELPLPSAKLIQTLEEELALSKKQALKAAAELTGHRKKMIYKSLIKD